MALLDSIRYFMGIPQSKNNRFDTACAVTFITILISAGLLLAFDYFDVISGQLGFREAIVCVVKKSVLIFALIAICIIWYQYIATGTYFLLIWIICFPTELILSKLLKRNEKVTLTHIIPPLNGSQTIVIPILTPKDISPEQVQTKPASPILPPNKFVLMLTDKCSNKNGLYNEFIKEEDESTITESLDFAIKYWALVKLELIPDNMSKYLDSVPSRYCPVKRGQLSNLVKKVKKSIKESQTAENEGYEAAEEDLEIFERYKVLKKRFKVFKDK